MVRFSNARVLEDWKRGGHGMSIKLFGVEGEKLMRKPEASETNTQDFLLFDNPVFFIRDAFDYLDFETSERWSSDKRGEPSKIWLAFAFPRLRSLSILTTQAQAKPPTNPLGAKYWSVVPFRLGPHVVKFRVIPERQDIAAITSGSENSINEALKSSMNARSEGDWKFFFEAQQQTDPDLMPIEDATVDWGQDDDQFVRVATIEIRPKASLDRFGDSLGLNWPPSSTSDETDAMKYRSEHLSFSPWHGLIEHEPLGGINRVRRRVYEVISARRHGKNGERRVEPEGIEPASK